MRLAVLALAWKTWLHAGACQIVMHELSTADRTGLILKELQLAGTWASLAPASLELVDCSDNEQLFIQADAILRKTANVVPVLFA